MSGEATKILEELMQGVRLSQWRKKIRVGWCSVLRARRPLRGLLRQSRLRSCILPQISIHPAYSITCVVSLVFEVN